MSKDMLDIAHVEANIAKLMAETVKLNEEGQKLKRERYWYPVVLMSGAFAAGGAFVAGFVKLFS